MRTSIIILVMFMLIGCRMTERKAKGYYLDNRDELARLCDNMFPTSPMIIQGETIYIEGDTVYTVGDSVVVFKDCPDGSKVGFGGKRTDTLKVYIPMLRVDTIRDENSPKLVRWQSDYNEELAKRLKAETTIEMLSDKNSTKNWWIVGLSAVILGVFIRWIWGIRGRAL